MNKVLFTASVDYHISIFHTPFLKWFKENGFDVEVATRGNGFIDFTDKRYDICFERSIYKIYNHYKSYKVLKHIIDNGDYTIIHCHTPVVSILTRLAAIKSRKRGCKVIYTAHGFHFYKGASIFNWVTFYPLEKLFSRVTDVLITINEEDYNTAIKKKFKAEKIYKTNGVGTDFKKVTYNDNDLKCYEDIISQNNFNLFFAAELSKRKNQILLFEIIKEIKKDLPKIRLYLAGKGDLKEYYEDYVEQMGLSENIIFLGYRNDVNKLLSLMDVAVSSSKQEGLPINIIEAMAMGLPVVATNIRGHNDLIEEGKNGFLFNLDNPNKAVEDIKYLYDNKDIVKLISENNILDAQKYDIKNVIKEYEKIYLNEIGGKIKNVED